MNPLELQVLALVSGVRDADTAATLLQERALGVEQPVRRTEGQFATTMPVWRSPLRDVSAYAPRTVKGG